MRKNLLMPILAVLTSLVMGCGNSLDSGVSGQQGNVVNPNPSPTATVTPLPDPDPVANLRIVNLVVKSQGFELQVDDAVIDADFENIEATDYIELEPGSHTVTLETSEGTAFTRTLTLADGDFTTLVLHTPDDGLNVPARDIRSQEASGIASVVLQDDTTPNAGQLNARLFNGVPEEDFEVELLTNQENLLSGPIGFPLATSYSSQNLANIQSAESLLAVFEELNDPTPNIETFEFATVEATGGSIIEAIGAQVTPTGANITAFLGVTQAGQERVVLFILNDDADDGNTSIVSISNIRER